MKHQRNFFVSILKFILITAAIFILLLFVSCVLFSFYYKDIFLQFFQREVSIGKVDFNISSKALTINDIHWAIPDGETLLSTKEIQIKPDFKKLLKLQIAFEEVAIDGIKTYVIQKGNSYKLPPFLPERKSSLNIKIPKIPVAFSAITVSNSTVHLRRGDKDYRFLSELTVKLPSVSDKMSEIKPVISGNLNRKPFSFVGKTKFNENGDIINQFNVSSRNLNIAENRIFLPVFPGIKMQQGIVNLDISIEYIIRKKRKSSLVFSGAVAVQNLGLSTNVGQIANSLTGRAVVRRYDFTQKQLDVESLVVNHANIKLPKDFFVTKNNSEAAKFQINIDSTQLKNTALELPGVSLKNISGKVSNFSKSLKNTIFDLSANLDSGALYANGKSNGMSEFAFDKLSVKNINLPQALPVTKKIKQLKSINIQQLFGSGRLQLFPNEKPRIDFSGNGIFSDAECEFDGKSIGAKNISVSVKDLNSDEQCVILEKLQFSGMYFKSDKTYLSDCSFVMEPGEHFLKLTQDFSMDDKWKIKTLSGVFGKNKQIFANISNVDLQLKMQLGKEQLNAQAACKIGDSVIYHKGTLSARLRDVDIGSAKLSDNKSLRLNIDRDVVADFLYLKTILTDTGSLEIAGIPLFSFGNNTQKSEKKDFQIHLSRLRVSDGEIDFLDNRKSSVAFAYKFTDISWKLNNFPSFIYPQGSLELSGKVDKANPFSLQLTCDATQIKGKFTCSNALLSPFSEYSQKYLGHSVKNGRLSMNIPFSVTAKEISSDVELQLLKPEFKRLPTSTFALNLDKTLRAMMNRSGMIDLKFPVSVLLEEKKIKYTDLFFEVLSKTLQSSSDRIAIPIQEEIIFDNVFSIVYFKGGSSNISTDTFLSEKMLEKLGNHKNVFAINGFVDKQNDTEYLKRELVAKALKKYITGEGETARKQALREMLLQEYGEESSDNEDSDMLLQRVLQHLVVSQDDFRALAFERAKAVGSYMEENYNIAHNKIYIREDNNIFENPYVSGISNSIAVIRSGRLVE